MDFFAQFVPFNPKTLWVTYHHSCHTRNHRMHRPADPRTQFDVLVDVLREVQPGRPGGPRQGGGPYAEMRRDVVTQIQENPRARLTLFSLALALTRERSESAEQARRELRQFASAVEDRFGVDILRTAAANRDALPEVPERLFDPVRTDGGDPAA